MIRDFQVAPPNDRNQLTTVANYAKKRLPNYQADIKNITKLLACGNLKQLKEEAKTLIPHDSKQTAQAFLEQYLDIKLTSNTSFATTHEALQTKLAQKVGLQEHSDQIKLNIDIAAKGNNKMYLTSVFNALTECQALNNSALEARGVNKKSITEEAIGKFTQHSEEIVTAAQQKVLSALSQNKTVDQEFLVASKFALEQAADRLQKKPTMKRNAISENERRHELTSNFQSARTHLKQFFKTQDKSPKITQASSIPKKKR